MSSVRLSKPVRYIVAGVAVVAALLISAVIFYAMIDNNIHNQIDRDSIETQFSVVKIPGSLRFISDAYHGSSFKDYWGMGAYTYWQYTYVPAQQSATLGSLRADVLGALQQAGFSVNTGSLATVPKDIFASHGNLAADFYFTADSLGQGAAVHKIVIQVSRLTY